MEIAPPSYGTATTREYWGIIARVVGREDMRSAALVNSRWHAIFTPLIWGNPTFHIGRDHGNLYDCLERFRKSLPTTRSFVRAMTHTLHFPPATMYLYPDHESEWLRDFIHFLPNLQSLVVNHFPFFDHTTLQALAAVTLQASGDESSVETTLLTLHHDQRHRTEEPSAREFTSMRLLDASHCVNTISLSLTQVLHQFPRLLYLDLSFTKAARDPAVLRSLHAMDGLRVLKLRGIRFRDEDVSILVDSIGLRVRSLDLRDNLLTDHGIRVLAARCFAIAYTHASSLPEEHSHHDTTTLQPPILRKFADNDDGEFEWKLLRTLTQRHVFHLAIEDEPKIGITNLYVSGNRVTPHGASFLVRSQQLCRLDIGSVVRNSDTLLTSSQGMSSLVPVLTAFAKHSISFLRIHHSAITRSGQGHYRTIVNSFRSNEKNERMDVNQNDRGHLKCSTCIELTGRSRRPEISEDFIANQNLWDKRTNSATYFGDEDKSDPEYQRSRRIAAFAATGDVLHPAMIPRVRTLTLTGVPSHSATTAISNGLICFIKQCAEESWAAECQAPYDYTVPPGSENRPAVLEQSARQVFALRRIILEISQLDDRLVSDETKMGHEGQLRNSITGDHDGETLWAAGKNDFTFFEDEVTTATIPKQETDTFASKKNSFDNLEILRDFRNDCAKAFDQLCVGCKTHAKTQGYWPGTIQVVRAS